MSRTLWITTAAAVLLAASLIHAEGWQPPSGGAVEMFRQFDRPFLVGAVAGGAGGEGAEPLSTAPELVFTERTLDFELVPVDQWDTPGSPAGNGVEGGQIHFFRPGAYSPSFSAPAGGAVALPQGNWYLTGEAPGWATTHETYLQVRRGETGGGGLVLAVMAACEVHLEEGAAWGAVDRLDVVSLTESAVYPLVPGESGNGWIPAGRLLTYSVVGDRISGIGGERACEPGDRISLLPPAPPAEGLQALIVETDSPGGRGNVPHHLDPVVGRGGEQPMACPDATLQMGDRSFAIFADLPAVPLQIQFGGQDGGDDASQEVDAGPQGQRLEAREGSVRQVRLKPPSER